MSDLDRPNGLVQWMVKLEAEAILLRGPLDDLAGTQQDSANPVVSFGGLIDQKNTRF